MAIITHLMHERMVDMDDLTICKRFSTQRVDLVFIDLKGGMFSLAEDLNASPLRVSMIMNCRHVAWIPGHDHNFEVLGFVYHFSAIAILDGMLIIGPRKKLL